MGKYPHLETINSPSDIQKMSQEELTETAKEIRSFLVEKVSENGGHLASNLGIVELTLALHRVFDSPRDHIIFDVGHQCYVHKILTGRREQFDTLRKNGGLSGFPKPKESVHDCFGTGHSSTSLSAALGFAEADRISGSDAYTVCVFGDGAYTGGMIHEALNNCRKDLRLIIILNENEMSISKNIGRFAGVLSRLRVKKGYWRFKNIIRKTLGAIPFAGKWLVNKILRYKQGIKGVLYGSNIFENLGLQYFGPVDGNDENAVEKLLNEAKRQNQSCILHVKTQKGRGFAPAEQEPWKYHGMAPADREQPTGAHFSDVAGDELCKLAKGDPMICAITAAMADGTGLTGFRSAYPDRFFDVGIAEEHAVTFAAGLAANGCRPAVAIYSTFLQRAYDSILHDVALQNLPVVFLIDRAGINCSDGPTHYGVFDVAFFSQIPGMRIFAPVTEKTLRLTIRQAFAQDFPTAIRYANGYESPEVAKAFDIGENPELSGVRVAGDENAEVTVITYGRIVTEALKAVRILKSEGISAKVLLLEQIAPYEETVERILDVLPEREGTVVLLEEEIRNGGMGMILREKLAESGKAENKKMLHLALENPFESPGLDQTGYSYAGVDAQSIVHAVKSDALTSNERKKIIDERRI